MMIGEILNERKKADEREEKKLRIVTLNYAYSDEGM